MKNNYISLLAAVALCFVSVHLSAQCTTSSTPSYSSGCTSEYFTSISASGTGVVSTATYTGSSCAGTYFNYFSSEGVTAATGSTVNFSIDRCAGYMAYLSIFVDWNNDGTYEPSELVGSTYTYAVAATSASYSFTIPLTGIVTNTHLHMRVFLGEPHPVGSGIVIAPCSAQYGMSCDYFLDATCTTPTLTFTPSSPTACSGQSTDITVSGAGPAATYTWAPAPGLAPVSGSIATVTPTSAITYTVTGYGPGVCPDTNTVAVTTSPSPAPVITPAGPTAFCVGGNVLLEESSGTGTSYQWYAGTTTVPGATNSYYIVSPATTTVYSVAVTNTTGCSAGTTDTVTIFPAPPAVIAPAGPATVCYPSGVLLNADVAAGYTYRWFLAGGVIGGATSPSYTAVFTNNYNVEVTSAEGCKDTSAPISVTINPQPSVSAVASGPLTFCSYDSVTLTGETPDGISFQWLNGTTPVPAATDLSYTAHTTGTYDYRLSVTNTFGCSDTTADGLFTVVINPAPVFSVTASGPLTICSGSSVTLSVPDITGDTYQWYYDNPGTTPTPILPGGTLSAYTASSAGYYYVTVTSPAGCTTSAAGDPDMVSVVDITGIQYNTPLSFCWGSHVQLSLGIDASVPGVVFQWIFDGANIPGANTGTLSAYTSGTYSCFVNVSGGCMETAGPVTVVENPLPNPLIIYTGDSLQTQSYYTSYQWYRDFSPLSGATSNEIRPNLNGEYSVIVTDTNGCISEADDYILSSLSIAQMTAHNNPVIYPNPATETVFINYPAQVNIVVSSMDGKKLLEKQAADEINISGLPAATYLIALYSENGAMLYAGKLVKE